MNSKVIYEGGGVGVEKDTCLLGSNDITLGVSRGP